MITLFGNVYGFCNDWFLSGLLDGIVLGGGKGAWCEQNSIIVKNYGGIRIHADYTL